jgi:hypothetical protein
MQEYLEAKQEIHTIIGMTELVARRVAFRRHFAGSKELYEVAWKEIMTGKEMW